MAAALAGPQVCVANAPLLERSAYAPARPRFKSDKRVLLIPPAHLALLIKGSTARNSSVAALFSHSKATISTDTIRDPSDLKRSIASVRSSSHRDPTASAARNIS